MCAKAGHLGKARPGHIRGLALPCPVPTHISDYKVPIYMTSLEMEEL